MTATLNGSFVTKARMSVMLAASYDAINRVIAQLQLIPAFTINETEHFAHEQVEQIREALAEQRRAGKRRTA